MNDKPEEIKSDVDYEVDNGLRAWNTMKIERNKLQHEITGLKEYVARLEAKHEEMISSQETMKSELEHFRLMAIEAKTHLFIIRGHVNGACERVKEADDKL